MNIEFQILDTIQSWHTGLGDIIMTTVTRLGDGGALWICLALVLLAIPKTRKLGVILSVSLVLDLLFCNILLKPAFGRIRPYEIKDSVSLLINKPHDYSFPSGHSAASYTAAFALLFSGHKKSGLAALVVATLIAFSRLYLYVHYPTDVLGGLVIGLLCGFLGNKIVDIWYNHSIRKKGGRNDSKKHDALRSR